MKEIQHRMQCSARLGGSVCECGAVHVALFAREKLAMDVIEWARSVALYWGRCPDLKELSRETITTIGFQHAVEQLCKAIAEFDRRETEE